jgi:hypothetical protein
MAHSWGDRYSLQAAQVRKAQFHLGFSTGGTGQKCPISSGLFDPHAVRFAHPKLPHWKGINKTYYQFLELPGSFRTKRITEGIIQ